jgi:hypothetical protein
MRGVVCAGDPRDFLGDLLSDLARGAGSLPRRFDPVCFEERGEFLGAEVGKEMFAGAQRWNPALFRKRQHFFRSSNIRFDVVNGVGVAEPVEFIHGAVAPGAPRFDVEFEVHEKLFRLRAVVPS